MSHFSTSSPLFSALSGIPQMRWFLVPPPPSVCSAAGMEWPPNSREMETTLSYLQTNKHSPSSYLVFLPHASGTSSGQQQSELLWIAPASFIGLVCNEMKCNEILLPCLLFKVHGNLTEDWHSTTLSNLRYWQQLLFSPDSHHSMQKPYSRPELNSCMPVPFQCFFPLLHTHTKKKTVTFSYLLSLHIGNACSARKLIKADLCRTSKQRGFV